MPQLLNVVDNIAKLFGFSRGSSGYCRQFVVFSTLRLFMRVAYFMACGHLCAALTEHSFAAYELCSLMRVAYFMACGHLCAALTYGLRPLMSYAHGAQLRCLCAALIVIHDEYDSRPYEPVTSFQQPKEVTKKGRPPTNFLIHIFIRLQCHSGERKHPCKALRLVQTSLSGHLTSRIKRWKIGVVKKPKAATSSLRHSLCSFK